MMWTGSKFIDLQHLDELAWSRVYHEAFGPCFTYDLSRLEEFEYVQYSEVTRPILHLVFNNNKPWKVIAIILHSKNDLPDARKTNGIKFAIISSNTKQEYQLEI